jgi:hypothetical protein
MSTVETYRFGAMRYTVDDVRRIAFAHGRDGIVYYPPQDWGGVATCRKRVPVACATPLEQHYRDAYLAGYASR